MESLNHLFKIRVSAIYDTQVVILTKYIIIHILGNLDVINEEDPPHMSTVVLNIDVSSEGDENGFENTQL